MTKANFTEEWIPVSDLEIDRSVQRDHLDLRKIERMVKNFNEAALGVIIVSRRNRVTNIVIDGMHRTQAVKEVTDNTGKVLCHVFHDLSRKDEAQMFLDLNAGTQPTLIDKYKKRLITEDPVAVGIDELLRAYGFTIDNNNQNGSVNAVGAVERVYTKSLRLEAEPNLLQLILISVTHAWGTDRDGVNASILDGLGAFFAVHGSNLDLDRFKRKLEAYKGGPMGLLTDARSLAAIRKGKISMAVAELLTDDYNKGAKTKFLQKWNQRSA
jgi:hypothetical protein